MRALIEGDEIAYAAGFSVEKTHYLIYANGQEEDGPMASFLYHKDMVEYCDRWGLVDGDDITVGREKRVEPLKMALYNAKMIVNSLMKKGDANSYTLFFSGKDNVREGVANTPCMIKGEPVHGYKGNRDPGSKPVYIKEIKDYLKTNYQYEEMDGLEADDGCSINQWPVWDKKETIIVCKDKDLDMVPGMRYNVASKKLHFITLEAACKNFYKQLLIGDKTDNIPGWKEFMGKSRNTPAQWNKAIDKLDNEKDIYYYILNLYEGNTDALYEVGNLIWMRQERDQMYEPGRFYYEF